MTTEEQASLANQVNILISKSKAGDKEAGNELSIILTQMLEDKARYQTRGFRPLSIHEQADLVQDSLLRIWRTINGNEKNIYTNLSGYLDKAIRSSMIDVVRHRNHHDGKQKIFSDIIGTKDETRFEDSIREREEANKNRWDEYFTIQQKVHLEEAINLVEKKHPDHGYRTILNNYFLEIVTPSIKQEAAAIKMNVGTLKRHRSEAKNLLIDCIREMSLAQEDKQDLLAIVDQYIGDKSGNNKPRIGI